MKREPPYFISMIGERPGSDYMNDTYRYAVSYVCAMRKQTENMYRNI